MTALSLAWSAPAFAASPGVSLPAIAAPPDAHPVSRAQVDALQARLLAAGGSAACLDAGLRHHFAPGMYGRELAIPAGMMVVGKIHRHQHLTLLLSGTATINTDRGMERISGPHVWVSQPGAKRALVTHTDCVFFTVHPNLDDSRDLAVIEARTIEPEPVLGITSAAVSEFADALQRVYA